MTPEHDDNNTGYIDIHYTHGRRTAALIATGWLTGGREYAKGADPFKLPRRLRNLALRRFGHDFDDSASYPRAQSRPIRDPNPQTPRRYPSWGRKR